MIYDKLQEIQTTIDNLEIFDSGKIYLGQEFTVSINNLPLCIIKSGSGSLLEGHLIQGGFHVIGIFRDADNIEQMLDTNLGKIIKSLSELEDIELDYFTTDEDVFQPFGLVIPQSPPFGAFRIEGTIISAE